MKRRILASAMVTACFVGLSSSIATAGLTIGPVVLTQGSNSYGDGGEFTATFGSAWSNILRNQQVFCVETMEEFSPGSTYYGNLSGQIMYNNGQFSSAIQPVNLPEAEYLFSQFATGQLDDGGSLAGGTGGAESYFTDGHRQDNAGALQNAIWSLLGETGGSGTDNSTLEADYITEATNAVDGGWTNTNVEILNMWQNADATGSAQDQLVYTGVPLPASASTGCSLLAGVALFALARKKIIAA